MVSSDYPKHASRKTALAWNEQTLATISRRARRPGRGAGPVGAERAAERGPSLGPPGQPAVDRPCAPEPGRRAGPRDNLHSAGARQSRRAKQPQDPCRLGERQGPRRRSRSVESDFIPDHRRYRARRYQPDQHLLQPRLHPPDLRGLHSGAGARLHHLRLRQAHRRDRHQPKQPAGRRLSLQQHAPPSDLPGNAGLLSRPQCQGPAGRGRGRSEQRADGTGGRGSPPPVGTGHAARCPRGTQRGGAGRL